MIPPPSPNPDQALTLIIDDCAEVHRLLKVRLQSEGLEFISAVDGEEGFALALARQPAIIILDLNMPGISGLDVLRRLKSEPRTQHIPVIVLSGESNAEGKAMAFELGASDYIAKPFELTELRLRVRSTLRVHRLMQLLAQRAQLDGLTGLWNRAHFDERWREEFERASRHGLPLSLALMDIDHFKQINDTRGHPVGDSVLQGLARVLQGELRQSDLACRYGGEEFAIIMPSTTPVDAVAVCERLRRAVELCSWPQNPDLAVTVSIGVAGSDKVTVPNPAAWIEAADQSLYRAKRDGRNRVRSIDLGQSPVVARNSGQNGKTTAA